MSERCTICLQELQAITVVPTCSTCSKVLGHVRSFLTANGKDTAVSSFSLDSDLLEMLVDSLDVVALLEELDHLGFSPWSDRAAGVPSVRTVREFVAYVTRNWSEPSA